MPAVPPPAPTWIDQAVAVGFRTCTFLYTLSLTWTAPEPEPVIPQSPVKETEITNDALGRWTRNRARL